MGRRAKSLRSKKVVSLIYELLETTGEPLTPRVISKKIEQENNVRCSVYRVGVLLRPHVLRGDITKTKVYGTHQFTYGLTN